MYGLHNLNPIESDTAMDAFCDEDGNQNTQMPQSKWSVEFKPCGEENTLVHNVVVYKSLADLEVVLNMGMKEGLTIALDGLEEMLAKITKR